MLKTVILIICWENLATWFPIIFGIASYTIEFTVDFDSTAYVSHRMGMNVILDYNNVRDDSLQRCRIQFLQIQAQILWSVYMHTEWCAKTMILNVTLSYDSFAKFFSWITTIMEELSSMCCPSVHFCLAALFFFFFFLVHRECYINILHMWQRIAVVFQSWQSHMLSRYHSDHSLVYVCYCTVEQTFNLKTVSVCKVYLHWLLHTCTTLTIFYIPL